MRIIVYNLRQLAELLELLQSNTKNTTFPLGASATPGTSSPAFSLFTMSVQPWLPLDSETGSNSAVSVIGFSNSSIMLLNVIDMAYTCSYAGNFPAHDIPARCLAFIQPDTVINNRIHHVLERLRIQLRKVKTG